MIRATYTVQEDIMGFYVSDNEPCYVAGGETIELVQENDDAGFVFTHVGDMCTTTCRSTTVLEQPDEPTLDAPQEILIADLPQPGESRNEYVDRSMKEEKSDRVKIMYDTDDELLLIF